MIIGDKPPASIGSLYNRRVQPGEAQGRDTSAAAQAKAGPDEIQISAEALLLQKITGATAQADEVRWDKVAGLRGQIAKGEYRVPVERLAGRLVNDAG